MADNQKYYYLRLKDDFFDREEIKVIESMPNGYKYSNILLKLYLKSLKRDGKLMVTDFIPYNIETLSSVLGHDIDTVRSAIHLFESFKLLDILDNGAIYLLDIQNFIGKSSTEADRKKAYRLRIESEKRLLKEDKCPDKCLVEKIEASDRAKVKNKKDKCPDKFPPEQEIKQEIEQEIEQQLYKDVWEILKDYYDTKEIIAIHKFCVENNIAAAVLKEKYFVIRERQSIKNRVGALISAIKNDWTNPKMIETVGSNYTSNNSKRFNNNNYELSEKKKKEIEEIESAFGY